jgi:hypothetical protein
MKNINYLGCYLNPTESQKLSGADVSFQYECEKYGLITILASQNGEMWQQWGSTNEILYLNVKRVQNWFNYINNIEK